MITIIDYALHDILRDDPREAVSVRRRSTQFYYDAVVKMLYRHSYDGILLHCLSNSEAQEVIKEAHDNICGAHQSGPKLKDRLHRLEYYWPIMIADAIKYARRCKAYQIHADFIHRLQSCSIQLLLRGHLKHGESSHRADQPLFNKWSPVYLSNNRLLFKMGRSYTTGGS